jgi:hypothetical protein
MIAKWKNLHTFKYREVNYFEFIFKFMHINIAQQSISLSGKSLDFFKYMVGDSIS